MWLGLAGWSPGCRWGSPSGRRGAGGARRHWGERGRSVGEREERRGERDAPPHRSRARKELASRSLFLVGVGCGPYTQRHSKNHVSPALKTHGCALAFLNTNAELNPLCLLGGDGRPFPPCRRSPYLFFCIHTDPGQCIGITWSPLNPASAPYPSDARQRIDLEGQTKARRRRKRDEQAIDRVSLLCCWKVKIHECMLT